ncbi:RING-14 protein-like protein [Rhizodiscina lignyota]|uniref:RING-14 protein-like protein n=1 Tax=Rhizodiscina lignyota TaxID=1504668 RepID=A0A9P4I7D1_9PEZI|nr:RING-14 protein-like protein [Rhizodiscina lignyota]
MKFARTFKQHLLEDGFPEHWVESAISYRKLKKCIKKVEEELSEIGLDADTLSLLLKTAEKNQGAGSDTEDQEEKPFQYVLSPKGSRGQNEEKSYPTKFQPKLLFMIDEATGEPLHAKLSPETKQYLHQLALSENITDIRITDEQDDPKANPTDRKNSLASTNSRSYRTVEVPLISDSQFFGTLQSELSGLATIQKEEEKKLSSEVEDLSNVVSKMTKPKDSKSKHDLQQWRRIFELYLDSRIFFSTSERDPWANNYERAAKGLGNFAAELQKQGLYDDFKSKEGALALHKFLNINSELLQGLKFQEINNMATMKILKKFDKRTALGATSNAALIFQQTPIPASLARAVCAEISNHLLATVPQLDDYLCPVCFSIAWRPVRLQCQHVFCIRCLIVMQRDKQDHCPLCRKKVVMEADSDNLDDSMSRFLKKYFPEEVKKKQKENERAAGRDTYGELYDEKCRVM